MEGVTYNSADNTLLWVDIIQAELHRVSLDDDANIEASHEYITFSEPGESIGALCLTKNPDVVLVCAKYGVAKATFSTKTFSYILKYPQDPATAERMRSNDGIIDPWGNLWIGTMNDFPVTKAQGGVSADGKLYRIDCNDLSVKVMVDCATISNGLAFSENGKTFYWTDSLTFRLWQYDYNHETLELSNRSAVIDMRDVFQEFLSPEPDGLAMAADGHVYQAVFSTSMVVEFTPQGKVVAKYRVPAERVTCTALGGPEDDELFVTTGHLQLDDFDAKIDASDKSGDLGGFLFRAKLGKKVHSKHKNVWGGSV